MKNCLLCEFATDDKCKNKKSQYYNDYVNEYMICREFKAEEKRADARKS